MAEKIDYQSDWDFYPTYIEEHLAVITLDLALFDYAPLHTHPSLTRVVITYPNADEQGLPEDKEIENLVIMEDALRALIDGYYAGRLTYNGARELFFYTDGTQEYEEGIDTILDKFRDFDYNSEATSDPEWKTYLELLFPAEREMQIIQSNRVLRYLQENEDLSSAERPIVHWLYFEKEKDRDKFVKAVDKRFEVQDMEDESPFGSASFALQLIENSTTDDDAIHASVLELFDLAEMCNGVYDGWETELVK